MLQSPAKLPSIWRFRSVKRYSEQQLSLLTRLHTSIFIQTCSQMFIVVLFTGIWIIFLNVQNIWLFLSSVFLLLQHQKLCSYTRLIICLSFACCHDTHLLYYFVLFVYALQIMAMVTTGIDSVELFIELNYLQLHSSTHILQRWVQMSVILGMTFNMTTLSP